MFATEPLNNSDVEEPELNSVALDMSTYAARVSLLASGLSATPTSPHTLLIATRSCHSIEGLRNYNQ